MVKRQTKRYDDGGDVFADTVSVNPEADESQPETFKEAFARSRSAGDKTFEWQGKKYTTEMASDKKSAPKAEVKQEKFSPSKELGLRQQSDRGTRLLESAKDISYDKPKLTKEDRIRSTSGGKFVRGATPMKKGGSVSSASKRADGCAERGKTKGKFV